MRDDDQPLLICEGLSKSYGRFLACNNVSFELYTGEVLAMASLPDFDPNNPAGSEEGWLSRMSNGTYAFTGIQFDVLVAATNTTPMGAYRGAGRPEATEG